MKKIIRFVFSLAWSLIVMLMGVIIALLGQVSIVNEPGIGPFLFGAILILFGLGLLGFGLFRLIQAGTVFLDSIDNISATNTESAQAALSSIDPLTESSALNKHQRNRLKFITALSALLLLVACFLAFGLPFAGDGCSFGVSDAFLTMAGWCFSYPFVIIGSVIAAWILQNKDHPRIALLMTALPILFPLIYILLSPTTQPTCR